MLVCVPFLAACGKEREPAPPVFEVKAPKGHRTAEFPSVGMSFEGPRNWKLRPRTAPGVFELASGEALVTGWAYPREEPLPETDAQLDAAKGRLVDAIEARDGDFKVRSAAVSEVAGAPAIDVRGDQVIARRRLRTRSVHVFEGGVEYVIEALAPPADEALVDTRVLEPLLTSLRLEGEVREAAP
jgi:hypothetical protein